MAKKKKPQDATLRNVRAGKRRTDDLEDQVRVLRNRLDAVEGHLEQVDHNFEAFREDM